MIAGQVREQLSAFQKESADTGNEEQIQQRLGELAKLILEYRNLYAEW